MKNLYREIRAIFRLAGKEAGQAFVLVLILLALGGLVLAPLLTYMNTGMKAEQEYQTKAQDFYAADAGIEDGLWQIKYDHLNQKFTFPSYDEYDYNIYGTSYPYPDPLDVNGRDVDVTITNIWIPTVNPVVQGVSRSDLREIIETGNILVVGSVESAGVYEIKLTYDPLPGEELRVTDIAVWLPPGFSYVEESSNLEEDEFAYYYPSDVYITSHAGGQVVRWHYDYPGILFNALPGVIVGATPKEAIITFEYESVELGAEPEALSWVVISDASVNVDIPFAWDADIKVYKIDSVAGDAEIEAYAIKSELRQLQGSIAGDYFATGNAFLYSSGIDSKYRDRMYSSRDAEVATTEWLDPINGIPEDGAVVAVYLYWTGWIDNDGYDSGAGEGDVVWTDDCSEYGTLSSIWTDDCSSLGTWNSIWTDDCSDLGTWNSFWTDDCSSLGESSTLWTENCSDFDDDYPYTWTDGSRWSDHYYYGGDYMFRGYSGGDATSRTVTLNSGIDLSAYVGQTVAISWEQYASNSVDYWDTLYFAVYNGSWSSNMIAFQDDNPLSSFSYPIPESYLTSDFRIRFFWDADSGSGNEYVYLDNIQISAQTSTIWEAGANWDVYNNDEFRGRGGGTPGARTITRIQDIDLSSYVGQTVAVSWEQSAEDTGFYQSLEGGDSIQIYISGNGGGSYELLQSYSGNDINANPNPMVTIPGSYLTSQFRIRYIWTADESDEYCYIDNIQLSTLTSSDWEAGANWTVVSNEFRGQGDGTTGARTISYAQDIDLSSYVGQTVAVSWEQSAEDTGFYQSLEGGDSVQIYISGNGGGSYELLQSYSGQSEIDNNPSPNVTIPGSYLTSQFRIRYIWTADESDEYCYIDNIELAYSIGDWAPGSHWDVYFGEFRCYGSGTIAEKTLSLNEDIDLSSYVGQTVAISWEQSAEDTGFYQSLEGGDSVQIYISSNGGGSYELLQSYSGNDINANPNPSVTIPAGYLTENFRIMLVWTADETDEYCYIDDIEIAYLTGRWAPGSHWDVYYGEFRCYGDGINAERTLAINEDIDLSTYVGETVVISWEQDASYSVDAGDSLYFYLSNDGGTSWGIVEVAFSDDDPDSPFNYSIPEEYLTDQFRIKFLWDADETDEYCYLDDITITLPGDYTGLEYPENPTAEQITALVENNARVNTVLFGSSSGNITQVYADNYQLTEPIIINGYGVDEGKGTWSYCCVADVTELVNQWIEGGAVDTNGAGTYTVENAWVGVANEIDPSYSWDFVDSPQDTGYPLGTPADDYYHLKDQNCHAGWSMIIIYSSAETAGHQLYLYDINSSGFQYTQGRGSPSSPDDLDFDADGEPGGTIKGFLVPEPIAGETEAGRITVFIGEGDEGSHSEWGDDYLSVNGTKLWDGINCTNNSSINPNDAWNSKSYGLNLDGIDIDTFSIEWSEHILEEGDTTADVDVVTEYDGIHIVYIILSFRSEIFTGGTITYLIN